MKGGIKLKQKKGIKPPLKGKLKSPLKNNECNRMNTKKISFGI